MSAPKQSYKGNKGLEYYKAYPRDFIDGTVGMAGELRGFYRMMIDLLYLQDGFLIDDLNYISGNTGYGKAKCRNLINELIKLGKIELVENVENEKIAKNFSYFTQKRVNSELIATKKFSEKQANNRAKSKENKGLPKTKPKPKVDPHETTRPRDHETIGVSDETLVISPKKPDGPDFEKLAFEAFNRFAENCGWSKVIKITPERRKSMMQRIDDAGGFEKFIEVLKSCTESDYLTGNSKTNFMLTIDFLLRKSSFLKILEGNYVNRKPNSNNQSDQPISDQARGRAAHFEGFRRAAEKRAAQEPTD